MTATLTLSRGPAVRVPGLSVRTIATTLAGLIILVLIAWVIAPSLFTSHDPYAGVPTERFAEPSAAHLFGTDQLGRDVFARVVHGTRPAVLSAHGQRSGGAAGNRRSAGPADPRPARLGA